MRVLEISVLPEIKRIKLIVQMPDPDRFLTSQVPHLPRLLFRLLPRLGSHTCHNDYGHSFRRECRETEIPHVFEHLIIELQLLAQQNPEDRLSGETEWNWQIDPRGFYHVSVDYENELLAIASIRLAERIINSLDRKDVSINMDEEIRRLRQVLELSRQLSPPVPAPAKPRRQRVRDWDSVPLVPADASG
ncbi:MAG: hypothetical protein OHK0029_04040 [Armatimonadaceae bacterium]